MKGHLQRRAGLRGEAGFSLIEVMVSAMLVVMIATATVSSIGQSQKTSGQTLGRGIRANLAEQDQERMRSMRATDLAANYSATRTITQQGVSYQVDSGAEFVQDANGSAVSCTSTGSQSSFLRLTTTVTPQASLKLPPLSVQSLYALPISQYSPISGSLIVKVLKADGVTAQPGVDNVVTGPDSRSGATNSLGCSVYQFLTPGAYTIALSEPGFVDRSLSPTITYSGTVTAGNINQSSPQIYDLAGQITYTLDSPRTDGHTEPAHPGTTITLENGGILPSGKTTSTSTVADGLFPFTSPYTAYTGGCAANSPTVAHTSPTTAANPNYYSTNAGYGSQVVAAGGGYAQKLREPVINTNIRPAANIKSTSVDVTITQTDSGCTASYTTTVSKPSGTYDGTLVRAGYPYGVYSICASATFPKLGNTSQNQVYHETGTGIANVNFAGVTASAVTLNNSDVAGGC